MWFERLELRVLLASDFGDAPAPYATLLPGGASHEALGPTLGALRDAESDGQPSGAGDGADDDGVALGAVRVGQLGAVATVNVQQAPVGARLDAWIDFNRDGSWGAVEERIFAAVPVVEGNNVLAFSVPSWAASGVAYARFRLSTAGGLGPAGAGLDGEVEDYAIAIELPAAATGLFGQPNPISAGAGAFMTTADVDGDGDVDVVTKSGAVGGRLLAWHENDGAGGFV